MDTKIIKIDEFNARLIKPEQIIPKQELGNESYDEALANLKQAEDSKVYIQSRHSEELAPVDITIARFQRIVDEMEKAGLKIQPVEVITEFDFLSTTTPTAKLEIIK